MKFTSLNSDTNCDCLENATEDVSNQFAMKTNKNHLRNQDFMSYWEKGKQHSGTDCAGHCSRKGISLSIFTEETRSEVVRIYKSLFPLAPKYKPYLSIVKFYKAAGKSKSTPNEINQHHYDFYKCDDFDFNKVILINSNELH